MFFHLKIIIIIIFEWFSLSYYYHIIHNYDITYRGIFTFPTPLIQELIDIIISIGVSTKRVWQILLPVNRESSRGVGWWTQRRVQLGIRWLMDGYVWPHTTENPPKGSFLEGKWDPLFQGNLGWWNIIIWPDLFHLFNNFFMFYFLIYFFTVCTYNDSICLNFLVFPSFFCIFLKFTDNNNQ